MSRTHRPVRFAAMAFGALAVVGLGLGQVASGTTVPGGADTTGPAGTETTATDGSETTASGGSECPLRVRSVQRRRRVDALPDRPG